MGLRTGVRLPPPPGIVGIKNLVLSGFVAGDARFFVWVIWVSGTVWVLFLCFYDIIKPLRFLLPQRLVICMISFLKLYAFAQILIKC